MVDTRRFSRFLVAAALVGATASTPAAYAQTSTTPSTRATAASLPTLNPTAMDDRTVVGVLHATNMGEAQLGMIAVKRAARADVRKYAQLMLHDHVAADDALYAAQGRMPRWGLANETLASSIANTDSTGHMAHTGSIGTTGSAGYAGTGTSSSTATAAVSSASSTASVDTSSAVASGTGTMATSGSIGTTGSAGYANAGSPIGMSGAIGSGSTPITSTSSPAGDVQSAMHAMSGALSSAQDAAFDRTYVDNQVTLHTWALQYIDDTLMPSAKDAALRSTLQQLRARIAEHLHMAETLQANIHGNAH